MWAETDTKDSEKLIHDVESAASTTIHVRVSPFSVYLMLTSMFQVAKILASRWHSVAAKTYSGRHTHTYRGLDGGV
jgi:hypothetical protein